jgi:short-subunit dehydrogenase
VKKLAGRNALVTGASGGLGTHIARRLAHEGMGVVVSGTRNELLEALAAELRELGVSSVAIPADLSVPEHSYGLVEDAEAAVGPIDLLVNNAGRESLVHFATCSQNELGSMVNINLTAPLMLTHAALPNMLKRGRGHVVFISSVAGKIGPPYSEPYAATKAGLIGLTQSLRAEYRGVQVGFSVVCPGFIAGDGMWQRWLARGVHSNRTMGETTVDRVVDRVLDAIRKDLPEVIESGAPIRPLLALQQLFPRVAEQIAARSGVAPLFRKCVELDDPVASRTAIRKR